MQKTFLDRLQRVLSGRKPHTWAATVGWTRGAVDSVKEGGIPGPDFLAALGRAENVNLNWALTGQGAPYRVAVAASDLQAAQILDAHLVDSQDWQPYLLEASGRYAAVLTMPASYLLKEKEIQYTAMEVVAGALGPASILMLDRKSPAKGCELVKVADEELRELEKGEVGAYELLRQGGILARHRGAPDFKMVRDAAAHYARQPLVLDPRERRIIEHLRTLKPEDQELLEGLVARIPPGEKH